MDVPQLPEALRWDHNAHYHRWLLRQLPAGPRTARDVAALDGSALDGPALDVTALDVTALDVTALDVGCGAGVLARTLATRVSHVDAVDRSPAMLERARSGLPRMSNVHWILGDVLDPGLPLRDAGYDVVTAVASLHHLPLRPALARLAELVRPGGGLVVVGLYRPLTVTDHLVEAAALPANAAVGAVRAVRGRGRKPGEAGMPVMSPTTTLAEVRAAAAELAPGARVRRMLFWRYTLLWRRPAERKIRRRQP